MTSPVGDVFRVAVLPEVSWGGTAVERRGLEWRRVVAKRCLLYDERVRPGVELVVDRGSGCAGQGGVGRREWAG